MRRQIHRRPFPARARFVRVRPWQDGRRALLPLVELPLRLIAGVWAGRAVWDWLGEEGVVWTDLAESRFLLLAAGGAAALAAVVAPLVTTRPLLWAVDLIDRIGPFRLVGAALGLIVGLIVGGLLVWPLPRAEEGPAIWLPFVLTVFCGLVGAVAFAGRPALVRRLIPRRSPPIRPSLTRVEIVPDALPSPNGHRPAEIEAPTHETVPEAAS
ncbi:MAG: hypothetical protein U0556_17670 [Dehalococcoidia bacterium]